MEPEVFEIINGRLSPDDDPEFWSIGIGYLLDYMKPNGSKDAKFPLFAKVGACSHWLRPHQTRWKAAGGFAAPIGYYGNDGYSRFGIPEPDWTILLKWDPRQQSWMPTTRMQGKKKLVLRISAPTRTRRHNQASVDTLWSPGTPTLPTKKSRRMFGFRKYDGYWKCVANEKRRFAGQDA